MLIDYTRLNLPTSRIVLVVQTVIKQEEISAKQIVIDRGVSSRQGLL